MTSRPQERQCFDAEPGFTRDSLSLSACVVEAAWFRFGDCACATASPAPDCIIAVGSADRLERDEEYSAVVRDVDVRERVEGIGVSFGPREGCGLRPR